ncbi:hypothetical protein Glove_4g3 [Diversispora epigaea]|uniref:Uncharacterized protein n=1 Tax=Diversispora epigaea TaxID=1348612 RepID=A0A397JS44_9GLOM|nr:hypothetical protein Glove_4g3 [Diversispora epigaea]
MRNSEKLLKDLRRVHANNRQNDKKLRRIKAAKELFRKNDPNIIDYDKESLLRIVDISSLKEKYNIRLPRSYKEQTSAPQTVHFSEELESTIPETVDELKTENQKLKKEIAELKKQNSQMEIDFEKKLEKSQENINQIKDEIDFLANINQQFGAENDQLIKNLDRFRKYQIPESISVRSSPGDSGTESEIIPSKRPKGRKLKSKKIAKTNKGKRKKLRRIKAAKELFRKNDPNIIDYDKESLLRMLADRAFHSPEMSDTDEEDRSKTVVNVYDLSWRSAEDEIDFLANINQQFGAENDQLIKNLDRFRKYRIPESISVRSSPGDSGTESEIIPSKRPKGRKLKSKKIAKTNKGKRVFGNNSEEDTESDDEKNKKDARNEMKTIIKTINSEFSLNYDQTFTLLKHLLRNVLDPKSTSSTTAQLQQKRNYSDEIQRYDFPPPAKTPNWACNKQEDVVYDTEFVQTEEEDELSFASTSSSKILTEQE